MRTRIILCGILMPGLLGAACGGGGKDCGEGTIERDGRCVPTISDCGPGTERQGDVCVPSCPQGDYWDGSACAAVPDCAPGTTFDPAAGECHPACADDQRWDGSECVPICAPGTQLDPDSGECQPAPETCAEGTSWQDGQCVPDLVCGPGTHPEQDQCVPDSLPDADVTETGDPDQAAAFDLPAAGEQIGLGGNVDTPADGNGDGYVEASWDAFAFTAPAGTWLRIETASGGQALPAFIVMSAAVDEEGRALFVRYGFESVGPAAAREVFLPRAGDYALLISDAHNFLIDVFGAGFLPVGGEGFGYYCSLENLGTPQPAAAQPLPYSDAGSLEDGGLRFYSLDAMMLRDVLALRSAGTPIADALSDVIPVLMLFGPDGALLREVSGGWTDDAASIVPLTSGGAYLLVQDFLLAKGPARDFAVEAWLENVEDCTGGGCAPGELDAGEHRLLSWDLLAGDFFLFNATVPEQAEENLRVELRGPDFELISEGSAGSSWNRWDHLVAAEDTWVYLWISGWTGDAVPDWDLQIVHQPLPLAAAGSSIDVPVYDMPAETIADCGLTRFSGAAGQVAVVADFIPHDPGRAWVEPAQRISDLDLRQLGPAWDPRGETIAALQPAMGWLPEDGLYLHRALDEGDGAAIAGGSYEVQIELIDPEPLDAPGPGAPVIAAGRQLQAAAEIALFTFPADSGIGYQVEVRPEVGAELQPRLRVLSFGSRYQDNWTPHADRRELGLIDAAEAATPGAAASLTVGAPYDGPLVIAVLDVGSGNTGDGFELEVGLAP